MDQEKIILKKYEPACVFCGNEVDNKLFHGKNVCRECAIALGATVSESLESEAV